MLATVRSSIGVRKPSASFGFSATRGCESRVPRLCGTYISGWNYWNAEFYNEFVRTGGGNSAYLEYAAHWVNVFYDLAIQNHC